MMLEMAPAILPTSSPVNSSAWAIGSWAVLLVSYVDPASLSHSLAAKALGAWTLGQTIVLWNADPGDLLQPSGASLLAWLDEHPQDAVKVALSYEPGAAR